MLESDLDVVVVGTGLVNSIAAAALSKAGFRLAHLDKNSYYGSTDASLSLDELIAWADSDPPYCSSISYTGSSLPHSRQYSISLAPSILPSSGPLITSLIASGVSKYGAFQLLRSIRVYNSNGYIESVPASKEDVFKSKSFSLLEKRRLMRFLLFATGADFALAKEVEGNEDMPFPQFLKDVFNLPDGIVSVITYALAYCTTATDPTLPALQRVKSYLLAAGRYGPSSFIVGHYGGAGEIAQGFCRVAAVSGSVYILDKQINSLTYDTSASRYRVKLEDFRDTLTCKALIAEEGQIPLTFLTSARRLPEKDPPTYPVARCIAVIDRPLSFSVHAGFSTEQRSGARNASHLEEIDGNDGRVAVDTSVLVFPPNSLPSDPRSMSVTALITGSDTMSCPEGKWIIYLSAPLTDSAPMDASTILKPYLDAVLSQSLEASSQQIEPLLSLFYTQGLALGSGKIESEQLDGIIVSPLASSLLPGSLDSAAVIAEELFRYAVGLLREPHRADDTGMDDNVDFWPLTPDSEAEVEEGW